MKLPSSPYTLKRWLGPSIFSLFFPPYPPPPPPLLQRGINLPIYISFSFASKRRLPRLLLLSSCAPPHFLPRVITSRFTLCSLTSRCLLLHPRFQTFLSRLFSCSSVCLLHPRFQTFLLHLFFTCSPVRSHP